MSEERRPADGPTPAPEQEQARLYEMAPCALLTTRPAGEIVVANQTFFDWLGAAAADVIGTVRFQTLLSTGSRIYYETHYAPLLQMQGFVSEIALEVRRTDGRICPVVASARQERDADGVVVAHHLALFDSRDRRKYEKELLDARKHAEHVSRELAAADQRKNEFIATLAHELRNPIAPIRTAVALQRRRDVADSVVNKTSEMMERQVGQLVRLIDDLLDLSRLSHRKLSLTPTPVDLSSVVLHAIESNEPLLREAGLRLESRMPHRPIYVEADASRLVQVMSNILNNATKFTPRGGTVTLTLDRAGDEAVLTIRDTGIGIAPAHLPRVFEMFAQVGFQSEPRGGLGIGLTLAKDLVERHGGRIAAHSDGPGTGTTFTVHLPALREAPPDIAPSPRPAETVRGPRRRILVVDDNYDSAELITLLLELEGHEVWKVHDGLEAVEASERVKPEVVLLDIGLPTLDGYEVARRLRATPGAQPVIVALTGWEQRGLQMDDAQFDAHLLKPVDADELMAFITELPVRS